jgi:hypothetical protein
MKKERLLDLLEQLELFLYRRATAVISVTNAFKQNLIDRGIDAAKIFVVTNGVDTCRFTPKKRDEALARELGLQGSFVAGYIGTHGMAHGLDTLLYAAGVLARHDRGASIRLLLLGDGAERKRLQARASAENLTNVIFIETVTKNEVARYWLLLDTSIIHLRQSKLFRKVIPSKLFECMGMAIPVLHGVEGETAEIVIRHEIGLTFEPENHLELVDRVLLLHDDWKIREQLARNGPVAAKQYDRTVLAEKMLKIIEACVTRKTGRHTHIALCQVPKTPPKYSRKQSLSALL